MAYETPLEIGETFSLTRNYGAIDSYTDEKGKPSLTPLVYGCIVKTAEMDLPASHHFGEQVLKWTLCVKSWAVHSTVKDFAVQPIKANNIKDFKTRFPGAFEEYLERYGEDDLPDHAARVTDEIHPSLIGKYTPKRAKFDRAADDRRRALREELAALEAQESMSLAYMPQPDEAEDDTDLEGGTSLKGFRGVPQTAKDALFGIGINTVEKLSTMPEMLFQDLGIGNWAKYKQAAIDAVAKRDEKPKRKRAA